MEFIKEFFIFLCYFTGILVLLSICISILITPIKKAQKEDEQRKLKKELADKFTEEFKKKYEY